MTDDDVQGFDELLAVTDNDLLDLILARTQLPAEASAHAVRVLTWLRQA
jgi:succinate dehydrogenase flavin-adding protein (antitoxin of CptAB toxin-antitoxin module)